jgi:hypothetical protein
MFYLTKFKVRLCDKPFAEDDDLEVAKGWGESHRRYRKAPLQFGSELNQNNQYGNSKPLDFLNER